MQRAENETTRALTPRVKEDASPERHDETLENEGRVLAAKRNPYMEPDTMPKEFSSATGKSA